MFETRNDRRLNQTLPARGTHHGTRLGKLAAIGLLALSGALPSAFAAPDPPTIFGATECAATRYGSDLGCTAQDVSITGLRVVGDTTSCVGGTDVSLDVEVSINFATPDRYDVGVFLANDGKDPTVTPLHGGSQSCSVSVLPNTSPFLDLDPGPYRATDGKNYTDTCGDGNSDIGGGTGNGVFYMSGVKVACKSAPGAGGKLYIPFVVSWDNQSSPTGDICTSNLNPYPNTQSKCNAPTIAQGSVEVVVLPTITIDDGMTYVVNNTPTDYTITIANTTGAALSNVVFTDPAAPNMTANSITCSASGGAVCPIVGLSVGAMQSSSGITIPSMPAGSRIVFTVNATLRGSPPDTVTNTAYVTTGNRSGSASDTDTFYSGTLSITPATLSKNVASSGTVTSVTYSYTLYNFGSSPDTVSLSALSSLGWTANVNLPSLYVPGAILGTPGSAIFSVTVQVPANTPIGTMDITTIKASGSGGSKATASAITTVAKLFTFKPDNEGAGGPGSAVWYSHTLQNNSPVDQTVTFTYTKSGNCTWWDAQVYWPDKVLPAPIITLPAYGGTQEIFVRVSVPVTAAVGDECTITTKATTLPGWYTASVEDKTTVKSLILYSDAAYTNESYVFPHGDNVYGKAYGLAWLQRYYFKWYDPSGTVKRTSPLSSGVGTTSPDTYPIAAADPAGTWKVEVWKCRDVDRRGICTSSSTTGDTLFATTRFYVGPDHLNASYTGANPPTSSTAVVNLALHDRYNHQVPFDAAGNLVKGNPDRTEDPLWVTITVSGSAQIVSTTLKDARISGQTVTGKLDDNTGTATLTITDTVAETVTVIPHSYEPALKGSPARDEATAVTFVVASLLDHIRLEHAGTALTCEPAPVTVKACADAACTALATIPVTVTLAPAAGWSSNGFTFTGSTTVSLSSGTPQTLTLGTTDVSPLPSGATPQCYVGATANCNLTFHDTGFIFAAVAGEMAATVPTQVAGLSSGTYYLRAVKKSDSSSACVAALTGARSVDFAYECNNPAACHGANLMSVNGGSNTIIQRNDNGAALNYTPVNLTFDANGNAPFTFNYGDVGLVRLHASKVVNAARLIGSTNGFVVKPHHFALSDIRQTAAPNKVNPAAADATGGAFVKAGEEFSVTVTAMTLGDTATPSYGKEAPPEGVKLTSSLVAPTGGSHPALANGDLFGTFAGGVATGTTFKWDEVGIIKLTPGIGDGNYLGAGDVSGSDSPNVGRFYPAKFRVNLNHRKGCGTFTYAGHSNAASAKLGQKFVVDGEIEAQNTSSVKTANYEGSFAKLTLGQVSATAQVAGAAYGQLTWPAGTGTLLFTDGTGQFYKDDLRYAFDAEAPPRNMYLKTTANDLEALGTEEEATKFVEYRFGRAEIVNANGSELLQLAVPFRMEYFRDDGAGGGYYTLNSQDSCTAPLSLASHLQLSNPSTAGGSWQTGGTAMTIGSKTTSATLGAISGGRVPLSFSAPGDTGYVEIRTVLATDFPWLLHDWNEDGLFSDEASGRATFGIYKGSARHIYLRELLH